MTEEEARCKAVERFKGGEPPKAIYEDLGRTKQWFFKWLKRYQSGEPEWYRSRSRAPRSRPTQTTEIERKTIIKVRQRLERHPFSQTGVSAIKWELHKAGASIPSDRTINRILKKEGLAKKNLLRPQRDCLPIFQRGPMPKQHSSSRSFRAALYQGRWPILFLQRHRCGYSSSLHRIETEPGRPTGCLQPHEGLEGYGNAGFSPNGQCAYLSRQQPLSKIVRSGNQAMPTLWGDPGVHPD
jgi:hypothetical protein